MNAVQSQFEGRGFEALGFPCNDFYLQEPGANGTEIMNGYKYVRPGGGYVPNFQIFQKIDVNGKDEHPLYTYLKKYCGPTSDVFEDTLLEYHPIKVNDVRWNFEEFLISKDGYPVYRFGPDNIPSDLIPDIQNLLTTETGENLSNKIMPY